MRANHRRLVAAACALTMLAAECGRDDKSDSASTTSAAASTSAAPASSTAATTGSSTAGSTAGSTASSTATSAGGSSTTAAAGGQRGPGDFGDLKAVCGPGNAKGATDQGVTDSEIVVGTDSDPGNTASPGLNQEIFDAGEAFVKWCNEAGGINGRKIKLNLHDAKLFEAGAAMVAACQTDFMLVGGGMALDAAAVEPRVGCGLTQIAAFTVSKVAGRAEGSIEAQVNNDSNAHNEPFLKALLEKEPDLANKFGLWNLDLPSVTPTGKRTKNAAEGLGYKTVVEETLPSAVDNWRPFVEKLKANDVQVLAYYGNPYAFSAALKSMNDVGYFPKYIFQEGNFYDESLIQLGGDLLSKSTIFVNNTIWPFELAKDNPATQEYIDMLHAYKADLQPKLLGVNSLSAWLLWAQSARDCGSELTRKCVMDKASSVADWTGGGLHRPNKPGPTSEKMSECSDLLVATPKGFVQDTYLLAPNNKIWDCRPDKYTTVADT